MHVPNDGILFVPYFTLGSVRVRHVVVIELADKVRVNVS